MKRRFLKIWIVPAMLALASLVLVATPAANAKDLTGKTPTKADVVNVGPNKMVIGTATQVAEVVHAPAPDETYTVTAAATLKLLPDVVNAVAHGRTLILTVPKEIAATETVVIHHVEFCEYNDSYHQSPIEVTNIPPRLASVIDAATTKTTIIRHPAVMAYYKDVVPRIDHTPKYDGSGGSVIEVVLEKRTVKTVDQVGAN